MPRIKAVEEITTGTLYRAVFLNVIFLYVPKRYTDTPNLKEKQKRTQKCALKNRQISFIYTKFFKRNFYKSTRKSS